VNEVKRMKAIFAAKLYEVALPVPFKIEAFCEAVAAHRGRPLNLVPMQVDVEGEHPFGLWIATEDEDWVCYQEDTAPLHRDVIVLHETAHMLLGHRSDMVMPLEELAEILPNVKHRAVRTMLARRLYSSQEETDAEQMAMLMIERSSHQHQRTHTCDQWIRRLSEALQSPRERWSA
jgi:hypothetical protein